jgi:hypothetical protein
VGSDDDRRRRQGQRIVSARSSDLFDADRPSHATRARIAALNDVARTAMGIASRVVQTEGIQALDARLQSRIRERVETFETWTPDNDPYGERDFGAFEIDGERVMWNIDYFDPTYERHSDDASNPAVTRRVLTIMLAHEY